MGCIDGDGGDAGVEHGRDVGPCLAHLGLFLQPEVVGVDGHGNGYAELVADGVGVPGQIPHVDEAVPCLGLGYLEDDGGIGPLGRLQDPRITMLFRALAAIVMALPFFIMARSMTLPLTMRAREFGNSLAMFGGRPISSAFVKSFPCAILCLLALSDMGCMTPGQFLFAYCSYSSTSSLDPMMSGTRWCRPVGWMSRMGS